MPPRPGPAAPSTSDDRFLWAIVAVPVVVGIIEMVVGYNPAVTGLLIVLAIVANGVLANLDINANRGLLKDSSRGAFTAAALLLMPFYVFKRQRVLGRPLMPLWLYLGLAVITVFLQVATGAGNYIDTRYLEGEMESWGRQTFGVSVDVECPGNQPARAGHRFICEMSDSMDRVGVRVTVLNSAGDVEWEVVG